jgi:hypothetical protein
MRWLLIAPALAVTGIAASAPSAAQPPDPCVLVSTKDAASGFGATPSKLKTTAAGASRSCTYVVKKQRMQVATSRVATQAAFDRAAKKTGLALPIQGAGADAWSVSEGKGLLFWKNGVQVSVTFVGVAPFVATQQSLVKSAVGRL